MALLRALIAVLFIAAAAAIVVTVVLASNRRRGFLRTLYRLRRLLLAITRDGRHPLAVERDGG